MSNQPVPTANDQVFQLYARKGELMTQVQRAIEALGPVEFNLAQIQGFQTASIPVLGFNTIQVQQPQK